MKDQGDVERALAHQTTWHAGTLVAGIGFVVCWLAGYRLTSGVFLLLGSYCNMRFARLAPEVVRQRQRWIARMLAALGGALIVIDLLDR